MNQGAKKIIFPACHSGKLKLAFTIPDIISTSRKTFLFFCYSSSPQNITCPLGKLKTKFTGPITKSTSPGLSDTTFFARWMNAIWEYKHRVKQTPVQASLFIHTGTRTTHCSRLCCSHTHILHLLTDFQARKTTCSLFYEENYLKCPAVLDIGKSKVQCISLGQQRHQCTLLKLVFQYWRVRLAFRPHS